MNGKTCATSDIAKAWDSIDWNKAEAYVKKLQMWTYVNTLDKKS